MKIIDNKKDYYDYISGIIGIDNKVVYDRRGSEPLGVRSHEEWFSKGILWSDKPKQEKKRWELTHPRYKKNTVKYNDTTLEGDVYFICIEIGYFHYHFVIERYIENGKVHLEPELIKKERVEKHIGENPFTIFREKYYSRSFYTKSENYKIDTSNSISNPIVGDTWVRKHIDANEVWNNLYEYISSLNDKTIVDNRSDRLKLESYGFDNKISFRKM